MNPVIKHLVIILFLLSSCKGEESESKSLKEKNSATDSTSTKTTPELEIRLNKNAIRNLNTSFSTIASALQPLLFGDNHFSLDEFFKQKITFRNNKGKLLTVPLESILDTAYIRNSYQEQNL